VITVRFYLDGDLLLTMQVPVGSPVPRVGETVRLPDDLLYDVQGVAYDFTSDGLAPEVIVRIDHF
jgi:hypothetical protein